MMEAALAGDINALYAQIREDPFILESFDKIPFADTPLHIAAFNGNTEFAIEIISLKPSFAKMLNCNGFSPMHLALQNEKNETVLRLLDFDIELVQVKGRGAITPLHYVAAKGNLSLLTRFLSVCPKSVEDVTIQSETALHLAIRNNNVEAFKLLFTVLQSLRHEEAQYSIKRILNWKDKDGNTLLHLATYTNQPEIVKCLIQSKVDINSQNSDGLTALDVVRGQKQLDNKEIENILRRAGELGADSLPSMDTTEHFLSLKADQRLNVVAQTGNVDYLYTLLQEDAHLLEKIDKVPFVNTPLHIAASVGHVQFALEIMRLKPSFARKQNQDGYCPIHLALQCEQTHLVHRLLDADRNLVRVQGREGKTSLHCVVEKDNLDLLSKLLTACPESIMDVTTRNENALHLAIKNNKLESLRVLLKWLQCVGKEEILKWTDGEGNTLLHVAISESCDIQMVRLMIKKVQINAQNSDGLTALDILDKKQTGILDKKQMELKKLLHKAGAHNRKNILDFLKEKVSFLEKMALLYYRRKLGITNESRNAVLVVAVLIATATYQAALTPSEVAEPGYKKQSDGDKYATNLVDAYSPQSAGFTRSGDLTYSSRIMSSFDFRYVQEYSVGSAHLFQCANIIAFYISMLEIYRHLPRGTAITLVYPLVGCFLVLMAARSQFSLCLAIVLFLLPLSFSLVPVKILFCTKRYNWLPEALGTMFKHYRSFHNEMVSSDHEMQRFP